jgi:hypothetical protein
VRGARPVAGVSGSGPGRVTFLSPIARAGRG